MFKTLFLALVVLLTTTLPVQAQPMDLSSMFRYCEASGDLGVVILRDRHKYSGPKEMYQAVIASSEREDLDPETHDIMIQAMIRAYDFPELRTEEAFLFAMEVMRKDTRRICERVLSETFE